MDIFAFVNRDTVEYTVMLWRAAAAVTSVPAAQAASIHQRDMTAYAPTDTKGSSVNPKSM